MRSTSQDFFSRTIHGWRAKARRREVGVESSGVCEVLETRIVMAASPVASELVVENAVEDFHYSLWNDGIAINSYAGRGGTVRIPAIIDSRPVTLIRSGTFYSRGDVTAVILPEGVRTLESFAFNGSGITSIRLPASVSMAYQAFKGADRLQRIEVDPGSSYFRSLDGVLFSKNLSSLQEFPTGRHGRYAIPSGTHWIQQYAFAYCKNLTSVSIPGTISFVTGYAFAHCPNLRTVEVAFGVEGLGEFAFRSCPSLTSVSLGEGVELSSYTFFDCPKLGLVTGAGTTPSNLRATASFRGEVRLAWDAPPLADDIGMRVLGYRVQWSAGGQRFWRDVSDASGLSTQVTVHGLRRNMTYSFRVTAVLGFPSPEPYTNDVSVRGRAVNTVVTIPGKPLWRL